MERRDVKLRKGTSVSRAYDAIKQRILGLEFKPGEELEESGLVRLIGVSRTPVREALIRLGAEGMVTLVPNQSPRVAPLELARLRPYFEALDICQRAVTQFAAVRRDDDDIEAIRVLMEEFEKAAEARDAAGMAEQNRRFHERISEAGDNEYLKQTYSRLLFEALRIARICFTYETNNGGALDAHLEETIKQHREMFDAIRRGDPLAAEDIAQRHAELSRQRIGQSLVNLTLGARDMRSAS